MTLVTSSYEWMRLRRTVGVVLLIAAPALAVGQWYSTKAPIATLKMAQELRLPATEIASAAYHASFSQASLDGKWGPTGFATLGTIGFLIGAVLLFSARPRSTVQARAAVAETA